jgi:hypothetical protein
MATFGDCDIEIRREKNTAYLALVKKKYVEGSTWFLRRARGQGYIATGHTSGHPKLRRTT